MGGQVLEYEAKTIYNEGQMKAVLSAKDVSAQVGLSKEDFLNKMGAFKG